MKEQNTYVKYTHSEIDTLPDETDWERVDALTDEDIDAAASSDPDAPPTDASFWKDATVVMPENMEEYTQRQIMGIINKIVEESSDGSYIYRGEPENHADPPYCGKVSSSLWRFYNKVDPVVYDVEEIQKSILREARNYVESDKNDLELLAEIQHYGGKTNLIDFATDYCIALFFACDGSANKCGRVILLNRTEEMREKYRIQEPRTPQHRVIAQKSIFVQPPYGYIEDGDYRVISIPKDIKAPMLNYLREYHGIFARKIYNDLHGYIKHQKIHRDAYIHLGRGGFSNVQQIMVPADSDEAIKHLSEGITHFNEAITQHPDFVEAYYHRGQAYYHRGFIHYLKSNTKDAIEDFNRAITDYTMLIKLDPNFAKVYHNRGHAYRWQGDYGRAIDDFTRVIQLDPNFAEAYHDRGRVYFRQEDYGRATDDFDCAVQLDPNNHIFRDSLLLIQERLEKLKTIGMFVAHLRSNGYPNLQVDRCPDIDALADPFAIEHVRIDTVSEQTRRDDWFMQAIDGLEEELSPYLPFRLQITLEYDAVTANQNWRAINRALRNWIIRESLYLADGRYVYNVPSIPFPLNVDKDSDYEFPGLVFYRNQPNDDTLSHRIQTLCDRAAEQLAIYQESGKTTVILIENNDRVLMHQNRMRSAIQDAYPNGPPAEVDKIWFADTAEGSKITFEDFTP